MSSMRETSPEKWYNEGYQMISEIIVFGDDSLENCLKICFEKLKQFNHLTKENEQEYKNYIVTSWEDLKEYKYKEVLKSEYDIEEFLSNVISSSTDLWVSEETVSSYMDVSFLSTALFVFGYKITEYKKSRWVTTSNKRKSLFRIQKN
jgi:hypothetical protein